MGIKLNASSTRKTAAAMAVASLVFSFSGRADAARPAEFARGRILIEARAGLSDADLDAVLKTHGGKRRKLGQSRMHVVDLPPGLSEEDVVAKLSRRPEIAFAELDRKVDVAMAVNDPYAGSEWHLSKIGAQTAWDTAQGPCATATSWPGWAATSSCWCWKTWATTRASR